jgi:hypothetical protein
VNRQTPPGAENVGGDSRSGTALGRLLGPYLPLLEADGVEEFRKVALQVDLAPLVQ